MPETNNSHEQNINPANFPDNRTKQHEEKQEQQQESTHQTIHEQPRAQNFSFSSNYPFAPGRQYQDNNSTYHVQRYQSPYNFQHLVTNSFAVLQPDSVGYTPKPNAIVRPIRRDEHNAAREPATQQQNGAEAFVEAAGAPTGTAPLTTRAFFSRSTQEVRSFADELSQKLRFLAPEENYASSNWMSSRNNSGTDMGLMQRPRFETTVPTGIFLPPPHELQYLPASMLRRHVYAYSSYPMILHSYYNANSPNNNSNTYNKDNRPLGNVDKEIKVTATRLNGVRATAAVAAATAAASTKSHSQAAALAGGLHITKAQFQQQLQQRRGLSSSDSDSAAKRPVVPPPEPYKNMMYDRRVLKGSNFGAAAVIADVDPFDKAAELRRRNMLRKRTLQCRNQRNVLGTPPPITGRKHEKIQTEKYLEKLVQRPPEFTVDTQTDLFLEKPPTPPYVPAKVGVDVGTEIGEGELFHFDAEAQPIIDVLVDACIEQSMLEVAHEMELDSLRKKQEEFLVQRESELAELRRLEAEELRLQAEKERRLRQDSIAKELDVEMQKSVTAAKLLQGHIASLVPEVLESIEPASDAVKKEQLLNSICPWLSAEVAKEVGHIVDSREILTAIIQEIIKQRAEIYMGYKEESSEICDIDMGEEEGIDEMEACPCEPETELEACPEPPPPPPTL